MDSYQSELPGVVNPVAYKSLHSKERRIHSMKSMYCCLSVCSLLMALLGLSYLLFDPLVKYVVLNRLVLKKESDFAELWKNPPITPHFKVYFFNLTNPQEFFEAKAKPNLQEVGPFTYHQKWIKENIKWHDNGTMSYSTRKEFKFIPEKSIFEQNSRNLTLINVPLISAFYQSRKSNGFVKWGMDTIFSGMGLKPYVSRTPEQFVWGYKDDVIELGKNYLPDAPPLDVFGFFTKKNQSQNLPTYTMFTGEGNPYNLSKISRFNGKNSLGIWPGDTCNKVEGSDGATFNPYIQDSDTLWFFNDQLCRSVPLVFDKKVQSRDLPGYRFVPRQDVFKMDPKLYPQNECFCSDEELCSDIGDGMFAVPKCQFKAPIVLSWPHFLHANQTFIDKITGMERADPEKHGFWFDIQPTTGTTLSAKARVQINVAIKKDESFTPISKVETTIIPLLWFEEGLDELGDDLLDVLGEAVNEPPHYKKYILYTFCGLLLATLIILSVTVAQFCLNLRRKKWNSALERKKSILNGINPNFKKGHAYHPSQGSGKFLLQSEDSSRQHSRNSSTGSTFVQNQEFVQEEVEKLLEEPKKPKI